MQTQTHKPKPTSAPTIAPIPMAANLAPEPAKPAKLLRIREVLSRYPVSRSKWYAGVKAGNYPAPVSLGIRAIAWRDSDIDDLIASAK